MKTRRRVKHPSWPTRRPWKPVDLAIGSTWKTKDGRILKVTATHVAGEDMGHHCGHTFVSCVVLNVAELKCRRTADLRDTNFGDAASNSFATPYQEAIDGQ